MNEKNRKPNRYKYYNYSNVGYYFITICTKDRFPFFGKIENNQMILNECGKIADKCWIEIPQHIAHIKTDEFIIMPNHIHGIIIIENDFVGNRHACSLQNENRQYQKLPVTVGSFKSAVSKLIHQQIQQNFQWQKSYYDHIIRDEKSLFNIREYIIKNPLNWDTDKNNLGKDKK